MRIGLTLTEHRNLKLRPHLRADQAFHLSAEETIEDLFPMNTGAAAGHLRSRGYDVRAAMLDVLVESGTVVLAEPGVWTEANVETAANYFEAAGMLVPYAMMCEVLGCSYGDFLRPLREAAERESQKYGRHVPDNDQYFVMRREPPRGVTDNHGNLVEVKPAVISFELTSDVKERLERGEAV
jgi:hypothetical protein